MEFEVHDRDAVEEDTSRNLYVPRILPIWTNWCSEKPSGHTITRLTEENASRYANAASRVGWRGRIEHALEHIETHSELDENLLSCLLECVITTVIALASDQVLPGEYLQCSLLYLQHIKNEFGEIPPNIAGFMNLISSKLPEKDREGLEKTDEEEVSPNVVITQWPESLQKRLRK